MIFDKLLNSSRSVNSSPIDVSGGGAQIFRPTVSGEKVDYETAQTYSAWWGCVRGISESIAMLPWNAMEKDKDGQKKIAGDHHNQRLLHTQPNPEMTSFSFREVGLRETLGRGNFYSELEKNRLGETVAVWPLDNVSVTPDRDNKGNLVYDIAGGPVLDAKDVFHMRGPGNGLVGMSVVEMARETISLGLAAEKFGGAIFGNGAVPSLVIQSDGSTELDRNGQKNLLKDWNRKNRGAAKRGKVEFLEKGFTVKQVSINPNDAQFLETRKFQIHEVCRWFRYPVHKLSELDRSTNNNIEAENISYVTDTLMPWIVRMESQADVSLFDIEDIGRFYNKINVNGLLRGDQAARGAFYKLMWSMGAFSTNDLLGFEDMNHVEGGDARFIPMNMALLSEAIKNGNSAKQKGGGKNPSQRNLSNSQFRLFQGIAKRFVSVETNRLSAIVNRGSFKEDAIKFYSSHTDNMVHALSPATGVALESIGKSSNDADKITALLVKDIVLDSADSAQVSVGRGEFAKLMASWNSMKPEKIAEKFITKVCEHV